MRASSRSKRLAEYLLLVFCLVPVLSSGKQKVGASDPWSGKYKWVDGNHEMTIEQIGSVLSVTIRNLNAKTDPPPGNLTASFIARISGNIAKFSELRDPKNCRVDLRRVPEGIIVEDYCGGPDGGLYLKTK